MAESRAEIKTAFLGGFEITAKPIAAIAEKQASVTRLLRSSIIIIVCGVIIFQIRA